MLSCTTSRYCGVLVKFVPSTGGASLQHTCSGWPLNWELQNLASRNWRHRSMVQCKIFWYLEPFMRHSRVWQTDGHCLFEGRGVVSLLRNFGREVRDLWPNVTRGERGVNFTLWDNYLCYYASTVNVFWHRLQKV